VVCNVINKATSKQNERAERKIFLPKVAWKKKLFLTYKC
jgi:hypothetical protein